MKLLFDQNLSRKLVVRLQDLYPNSSHVQLHKLAEVTDTEVWNFAKENGFYIVTQDVDFSERSRLYGSPPKIIWLRCGNVPTNQVEFILRSGIEAIQELENNGTLDCLELY